MNVVRHGHVRDYLARAGDWLAAAPAENNLSRGIAAALVEHPERVPARPWLLTVEDAAGNIVSAPVMTPPHRLVVTGRDPAAMPPLAEHLLAAAAPVSGVVGPPELADAFAEVWIGRTGKTRKSGMLQGIYECDRVALRPPAAGSLRAAKQSDEALLVNWAEQFAKDAHLLAAVGLDDMVRQKIAAGDIYLWHDRRAVTMACISGQTDHGARVGFVYTPPALRRKGYATACVAALTEKVLAERRLAFLFTDLANPTSNGIYQRIGYRLVCEGREWVFA